MRPIKFRAWDKATKKHWDPAPLAEMVYFSIFTVPEFIGSTYNEEGNLFKRRFELMQYTGLKDKNHVEIYEGDILRVTKQGEEYISYAADGQIDDVHYDPGYVQVGHVEFKSCSFAYKTDKTLEGIDEDIHMPIDWLESYEVIGNIYEHPHLIKEI